MADLLEVCSIFQGGCNFYLGGCFACSGGETPPNPPSRSATVLWARYKWSPISRIECTVSGYNSWKYPANTDLWRSFLKQLHPCINKENNRGHTKSLRGLHNFTEVDHADYGWILQPTNRRYMSNRHRAQSNGIRDRIKQGRSTTEPKYQV